MANFQTITNLAAIGEAEEDLVHDGWTKLNNRVRALLEGQDPSKMFQMFQQADDEHMNAVRARVDELVKSPELYAP